MNLRPALLSLALVAALPAVAHAERGLEVRDLAKLDRVSSPILSPDGRKVVFSKRVVNFDANKVASALWIEDLVARVVSRDERDSRTAVASRAPDRRSCSLSLKMRSSR